MRKSTIQLKQNEMAKCVGCLVDDEAPYTRTTKVQVAVAYLEINLCENCIKDLYEKIKQQLS